MRERGIEVPDSTPPESPKYAAFKKAYWNRPADFVADCIKWPEGKQPSAYQLEILASLPGKRRVSVRGPHGLGKTAMAAWTILWFALTRDGCDWKIPTTASAWRQLTHYLWPEVNKWARLIDWDKVGRPPMDTRFELHKQSIALSTGAAFAVACVDAATIEGAHADHLLYVFDESKTIPDSTWDAAEGAFASEGEAFALAISTPGGPEGRFYEIQSRKPGYEDWYVRHVKLEEAIAAHRVTQEWVDARCSQWGQDSAVYKARVLGEFTDSTHGGLIPLHWVEQANERWREWDEGGRILPDKMTQLGADIARYGSDLTVYAFRYDLRPLLKKPEDAPDDWMPPELPCHQVITHLEKHGQQSTMTTAGQIKNILKDQGGLAMIDIIGIGAGVYDSVIEDEELWDKAVGFVASAGTDKTDRSGKLYFVNKRSAGWWAMRELLDPENGEEIALPPDARLIGDLTTPTWQETSTGRIKVQGKEDIRKARAKGQRSEFAEAIRSTDEGDAVMQAFWDEVVGVFFA